MCLGDSVGESEPEVDLRKPPGINEWTHGVLGFHTIGGEKEPDITLRSPQGRNKGPRLPCA